MANNEPVVLPELPSDIEQAIHGRGFISKADLDFVRRAAVLQDRATRSTDSSAEVADMRIEDLRHAIEGECDGLAISRSQAVAILNYLGRDRAEAAKLTTAPHTAADRATRKPIATEGDAARIAFIEAHESEHAPLTPSGLQLINAARYRMLCASLLELSVQDEHGREMHGGQLSEWLDERIDAARSAK